MSGTPQRKVVLAVHGGAGIILRDNLSPQLELQYRSALKEALLIGFNVLCDEKRPSENVALDAVEAAVRCMEQNPLFNAGRGSVFAADGKIRMDASIMGCFLENKAKQPCKESNQGVNNDTIVSPHQIIHSRKHPAKPHPKAGSVAGVSNIQNPIVLARQVMERTPHVMLIGEGAEEFARSLPPEVGVKIQPDEYFYTERRWNQLFEVRQMEMKHRESQTGDCSDAMMVQLDHSSKPPTRKIPAQQTSKPDGDSDSHKFGTVGCVALYTPTPNQSNAGKRSQLASATSTGGMTNQRYHRVGDSPIIGAGTYANSLCAVSCTGHGEWFIQCVAAHDVVKRLEYKYDKDDDRGVALQKAVNEVVFGTLMRDDDGIQKDGGDGGLIALDRDGNFVASMNCSGMYHGWIYENGEVETRIFWDEMTK